MTKSKVVPLVSSDVVEVPKSSRPSLNSYLLKLQDGPSNALGVSIEFLRALQTCLKSGGIGSEIEAVYVENESEDDCDDKNDSLHSISKAQKHKSHNNEVNKSSSTPSKGGLFGKSLFKNKNKIGIAPVSATTPKPKVSNKNKSNDDEDDEDDEEGDNEDEDVENDSQEDDVDPKSDVNGDQESLKDYPFMTHEVVDQFIKPLIPSCDCSLIQHLVTNYNNSIPHPELNIVCNSKYISAANVYICHQYTYTFDALIDAIEGFIRTEEAKVEQALSSVAADGDTANGVNDDSDDHPVEEQRGAEFTPHNSMKVNTGQWKDDDDVGESDNGLQSISFKQTNNNKSTKNGAKRSNSISITQSRKYFFWLDFCSLNQFTAAETASAAVAKHTSDNDDGEHEKHKDSNKSSSVVGNLLTSQEHIELMGTIQHVVLILIPTAANNNNPYAVPTPLTRTWILYEILLTQLASVTFSIQFGTHSVHDKYLQFLATHNLDVINGILNSHKIEVESSFCSHNSDKQFINNSVLMLLDDGYVEANSLIIQAIQSFIVSTAIQMTKRNIAAVYKSLQNITAHIDSGSGGGTGVQDIKQGGKHDTKHSSSSKLKPAKHSNKIIDSSSNSGNGNEKVRNKIATARNSIRIKQPAASKGKQKILPMTSNMSDKSSASEKQIVNTVATKHTTQQNSNTSNDGVKFTFFDYMLLAFGLYSPSVVTGDMSSKNKNKKQKSRTVPQLTHAQAETLYKIGALKVPTLATTEADSTAETALLPQTDSLGHNYLDPSTANNSALSEQLIYIDYFEYSLNLTTLYMDIKDYATAENIYCDLLAYNERDGTMDVKNDSESHVDVEDESVTLIAVSKHNHAKSATVAKKNKHNFHLSASHPLILAIQGNLALLYKIQHKYTLAIEKNKHILNVKQSVLGTVHPSALLTMYNLACCYKDYSEWMRNELHTGSVLGVTPCLSPVGGGSKGFNSFSDNNNTKKGGYASPLKSIANNNKMPAVHEEMDEEVSDFNLEALQLQQQAANREFIESTMQTAIDLYLDIITEYECNYSDIDMNNPNPNKQSSSSAVVTNNVTGSMSSTRDSNAALTNTINAFLTIQKSSKLNTSIDTNNDNNNQVNDISGNGSDRRSSSFLTNNIPNSSTATSAPISGGSFVKANTTLNRLTNRNSARLSSLNQRSALPFTSSKIDNENTTNDSDGTTVAVSQATSSVTSIYLDSINHLAVIYLTPDTEHTNEYAAKLLLQKLLYLKISLYGELHYETLHTYETVGTLYISTGNSHQHDGEEQTHSTCDIRAEQQKLLSGTGDGSLCHLDIMHTSSVNNSMPSSPHKGYSPDHHQLESKGGVKQFGNSFLFNNETPSDDATSTTTSSNINNKQQLVSHVVNNDHHEMITNYKIACECFTKVLQIRELLYGMKHYSTIQTMLRLAKYKKKISTLYDQNKCFPDKRDKLTCYTESLQLFYKVCAYYEYTLVGKTHTSGQSYYRYQYNVSTNDTSMTVDNTEEEGVQSNTNTPSSSNNFTLQHASDIMHPSLIDVYENISDIYLALMQYDKAEPLLLILLSNKETMFGAHALTTLTTLFNIADMYQKQNKQAKYILAENYHLRCLNGRIITLTNKHYDTLVSTYQLACCLVYLQKYVPSVELLERALNGFDDYYTTYSATNTTHSTEHLQLVNHTFLNTDVSQPNNYAIHHTQLVVYSLLTCEHLANVYRVVKNISKSRVLYERLKRYYKVMLGANHSITVGYTKILMSKEYYK